MKKAIKKVAPACFGACIGSYMVRGINMDSFFFDFLTTYLIVTFVVSVLFWFFDKVRGK